MSLQPAPPGYEHPENLPEEFLGVHASHEEFLVLHEQKAVITNPCYVSRQNSAEAKLVRNDPDAAIRSMRNSLQHFGADYILLNMLIDASAKDHRLRQAGVTSIFIRLIMMGYKWGRNGRPFIESSYTPAPCHWELPLKGIANVIQCISTDNVDLEDPSVANITTELRYAYSNISSVILRDLNRLVAPGSNGDSRRFLVVDAMWRLGNDLKLTGCVAVSPHFMHSSHCHSFS